jgi:hypothetical protein
MVKKYAEVEEISGVRTVINIVLADDETAKERGYEEIPGAEIGCQEIGGKFQKPPQKEKPKTEAESLLDLLIDKKIITKQEAQSIRGAK